MHNGPDRLKIYTSDTEWVHIDREDISCFVPEYSDTEEQGANATFIAGGKEYMIKGGCDTIRYVHLWILKEVQSLPYIYFMNRMAA